MLQNVVVWEACEIAGWEQTPEAPTAKLNKDLGPYGGSPGQLLSRGGIQSELCVWKSHHPLPLFLIKGLCRLS